MPRAGLVTDISHRAWLGDETPHERLGRREQASAIISYIYNEAPAISKRGKDIAQIGLSYRDGERGAIDIPRLAA